MVKQYFKYYEVVDYSAGSVFKEGYKSNKDVPSGTPLFFKLESVSRVFVKSLVKLFRYCVV